MADTENHLSVSEEEDREYQVKTWPHSPDRPEDSQCHLPSFPAPAEADTSSPCRVLSWQVWPTVDLWINFFHAFVNEDAQLKIHRKVAKRHLLTLFPSVCIKNIQLLYTKNSICHVAHELVVQVQGREKARWKGRGGGREDTWGFLPESVLSTALQTFPPHWHAL